MIYSKLHSTRHGRVYDDRGEAVMHCSTSDGFERWSTCWGCGRRQVACFDCGSVDRQLSECECEAERRH